MKSRMRRATARNVAARPIFAYVRAARTPINERGIITRPDLVVVADDTLVPVPAAGVLAGISARTVLLINTRKAPATWQQRLNITCPVITLPASADVEDRAELPYIGATCAGAAACLVGVIGREALADAIRLELAALGEDVIESNLENALEAYGLMQAHSGLVSEGGMSAASGLREPRLGRPALRGGAHRRTHGVCGGQQRRGAHRPVAHPAAGHRLRSLQWLLVGVQHLLSGRCHRRDAPRSAGDRLRPLQGLPGVRGPVPAARHRGGGRRTGPAQEAEGGTS